MMRYPSCTPHSSCRLTHRSFTTILASAFKWRDNLAAAIPELETAEKLDPAMSEPPYVLGILYLQGRRYTDAAGNLSASLKLQPENGDGWATLGSVYNHLDQLPEATAALDQAIQRLPLQPDPHLTLAARPGQAE